MSTLKTHDLEDIVAVVKDSDESPGNLVKHVDDKNSLGTVVAYDPRPQGFSKQPQVTVLWSKEPLLIQVQSTPINAQSRVLRARWQAEEAQDFNAYGAMSGRAIIAPRTILRGEEEYNIDELSSEELEQLQSQADNITYHDDGTLVVKRRSHETPDYLRQPDGTYRSTYHRR